MRRAFAALDGVLIERVFQPIADLISLRIRINRAAVVCLLIDLASLSWIVSRSQILLDAMVARDVASKLLNLSFLLLGLAALTSLRMLFRRMEGRQRNPLRLTMRPHRAVVLLMLATELAQLQTPQLADAADLAMLAFAACALYLGACGERPPARNNWPARLESSAGS